MTTPEIIAWTAGAVAVIGAIGAQITSIIVTVRTNAKVGETGAMLKGELAFARQREYQIQDAVAQTHAKLDGVSRSAEKAYDAANHGKEKLIDVKNEIVDLNQRLIDQGKLADQASLTLPKLQQTAEATKAAVESAVVATEETKQIAQDIHAKLEPPR